MDYVLFSLCCGYRYLKWKTTRDTTWDNWQIHKSKTYISHDWCSIGSNFHLIKNAKTQLYFLRSSGASGRSEVEAKPHTNLTAILGDTQKNTNSFRSWRKMACCTTINQSIFRLTFNFFLFRFHTTNLRRWQSSRQLYMYNAHCCRQKGSSSRKAKCLFFKRNLFEALSVYLRLGGFVGKKFYVKTEFLLFAAPSSSDSTSLSKSKESLWLQHFHLGFLQTIKTFWSHWIWTNSPSLTRMLPSIWGHQRF